MIEAASIGYRVGRSTLLDGVSVTVRPGCVTAVVGTNGAGKSTLLRLLSGELKPTAGEVRLDGRPLSATSAGDVAKRRAVMPQSSSLPFPFRAYEVVLLGRTPHVHGRAGATDQSAVAGALEHAGASHLARRYYPTLSGGERQRVDFARALAQVWEPSDAKARYLLLDEPTASLDLARQHELLGAVRRFAQEDVGVLVVIHDLNLAARYADEVLVLKSGRNVAHGAPWSVLTPEGIHDAFGLPVVVTNHPCHDCPLVVADPTAWGPTNPPISISLNREGGAHELAGDRIR